MGLSFDTKDRAPLGLRRPSAAALVAIFMIVSLALLTTLVVTAMLPRWYLSAAKIRVENRRAR